MRHNLIFCFFLCLLAGCSDDDDRTTGFLTTNGSGDESSGVQRVTIDLGKKMTSVTSVYFQVAGSAALDGDYNVKTSALLSSTLMSKVQAGQSTTTMEFTILDDGYVEPYPETVYFYISSISDESIGDLSHYIYQYDITDNDLPPTHGLQVDLSWNLGDGVSIYENDFDLYLVNNVVLDGDIIDSYDSVQGVSSVNRSGFESYTLSEDLPDDEYYVMIRFNKGTSDAVVDLILSQGDEFTPANGFISKENVGRNFFYGPVNKDGLEFSRQKGNAKSKPYENSPGKFISQKD